MTAIPAAGYFSNPARTNAEAKQAQDDTLAVLRELLGGEAASELTIASGAVTPTRACHTIDTEADAAADDLANIVTTNQPDGRMLLVRVENAARVVTLKHNAGGAGQVALAGAADYALDSTAKWVLLKRTGANWEEVLRAAVPASETLAGLAERATQGEADGGSDDARYLSALKAFIASSRWRPAGDCQLQYVSSTQLKLARFGGRYVFIDGQNREIPSGGVTLANTGLTAATLYYVYAYMNAGTLTLEASATAPATDATYGHRIKTGDATRSLVGMAYTAAGTPGTFADADATRYVRSWFNDAGVVAWQNCFAGNTNSSSTSITPSGNTPALLVWAGEQLDYEISGGCLNDTGGQYCGTYGYLDGSLVGNLGTVTHAPTANYYMNHSSSRRITGLAEGRHYAQIALQVSGGVGTWFGGTGGSVCGISLAASGRRS